MSSRGWSLLNVSRIYEERLINWVHYPPQLVPLDYLLQNCRLYSFPKAQHLPLDPMFFESVAKRLLEVKVDTAWFLLDSPSIILSCIQSCLVLEAQETLATIAELKKVKEFGSLTMSPIVWQTLEPRVALCLLDRDFTHDLMLQLHRMPPIKSYYYEDLYTQYFFHYKPRA